MRKTLVLVPLVLAFTACGGPVTESPAERPSNSFPVTPDDAEALLLGDVGSLKAVNHAASVTIEPLDLEARSIDYVEMNAHWGDGRWAMLGVDFLGGVNHEAMMSGETLRFVNNDWAPDQDVQPRGLFVAAVGCADDDLGDERSMFDEMATSVEVTRRLEGDAVVFDVEATFADGNALLGTFPLEPQR